MTIDESEDHDAIPFEALQLQEPLTSKSFIRRMLPHVVMLIGLFVALVLGVLSGSASCIGVAMIGHGDSLLPLGAAVGIGVTVVVIVVVYRWHARLSERICKSHDEISM